MQKTHEHLKAYISNLPGKPGVYKFFDDSNNLIYVGKAKNLKNRVSSYFNGQHDSRKTAALVRNIVLIEFTIVNSEFDAFLLENSLIKEFQPKYNIRLRDDKTYPYICILNERFPRIITTRKFESGKGTYFGPYTSVKAMKTVLDLIRKIYTIRTCSLSLTEENVNAEKFKVCLEYHIGNCKGPCENLQSEKDYNEDIESARQILKGKLQVVKQNFIERIKKASEEMQFELAHKLKNKYDLLEKFHSRSVVVNKALTEVDVYAIIQQESTFYISFLYLTEGAITKTKVIQVKGKLEETKEEVLQHSIMQLREEFQSEAKTLLVNIELDEFLPETTIQQPQIGEKKKLIALAEKNAMEYKNEKELQKLKLKRENIELLHLKNDLRLKDLPNHIECFDNSNIQGTHPVAAMVCFKKGKPSKKDYRHYHIKTVIGPDDFASMKEIVSRRYKRLAEEKQPLPNLVVIDGGKGQLSAAVDALNELGLYGKIPIIGIAKRLEEIYYPEDPHPLHINKNSQSLRILQHLRNEAHRFAITFHRNIRSKSFIESSNRLEDIEGIGKSTATKLLRRYKTYQNVLAATETELTDLVGNQKAQLIMGHKKRES